MKTVLVDFLRKQGKPEDGGKEGAKGVGTFRSKIWNPVTRPDKIKGKPGAASGHTCPSWAKSRSALCSPTK